MSIRNLAQRLKRLEARLIPTGEPLVIQILWVSPDGSAVDGPRLTVGATSKGAPRRAC